MVEAVGKEEGLCSRSAVDLVSLERSPVHPQGQSAGTVGMKSTGLFRGVCNPTSLPHCPVRTHSDLALKQGEFVPTGTTSITARGSPRPPSF